jgi:hypothetical protein
MVPLLYYFLLIHSPLLSRLFLGLPSFLFPSVFSVEILYTFLITMGATCSAHLNLVDFDPLLTFGEEYRPELLIVQFFHSPVTLSFLCPKEITSLR